MDKQFLSIDEMKEKIDIFGDKTIWLEIEKISNYQDRISYRQVFFLADGNLDKN